MRQLRLFIDDAQAGSGAHVLLEVAQGRRWAHLLHVPTLSHVKLPRREVEAQLRSGRGCEVPIRRGLIGRIAEKRRQFDRHGFRYAGAVVRQALAAARAA